MPGDDGSRETEGTPGQLDEVDLNPGKLGGQALLVEIFTPVDLVTTCPTGRCKVERAGSYLGIRRQCVANRVL